MPNWCEGYLKVRGTITQLKNFVLNGLQPIGFIGNDKDKLTFEKETETSFYASNIKATLYLEGTRRHFSEPDEFEVYAKSTDDKTILIIPMRAAWGIDAESLLNLCTKYEVDMKIQGFERGAQFSQIVEIVDGEIVQDEEIKYKDWDWDCPCPLMGG